VVLSLLSYRKLKKVSKKRSYLKSQVHKKDSVNLVKIFLPVVTIIILSYIGAVVVMRIVFVRRNLYRELNIAGVLLTVLTLSFNFVIYYWRSTEFKQHSKELFKTK